MPRRSSAPKRANFFKPIEFHLQPPYLLEPLLFPQVRLRGIAVGLLRKHLGQAFRHFLLPLAHLHRMHLVPGVNRVPGSTPLRASSPTWALNSGLYVPRFFYMTRDR